jgi:hypothetical protein
MTEYAWIECIWKGMADNIYLLDYKRKHRKLTSKGRMMFLRMTIQKLSAVFVVEF